VGRGVGEMLKGKVYTTNHCNRILAAACCKIEEPQVICNLTHSVSVIISSGFV
jgi:hypothetical protein